MPGSNTGHLPQSLMSLPGELLCVPAVCHTYHLLPTFEAMTPGDTNDINHLILVEDSRDWHSLLQMFLLFLHQNKILIQLFLSCLILPLLTVLGEECLITHVPVFVESALALVTKMGGVDDGNCFYLLSKTYPTPLIHTEACALHLPDGVGHASLVPQKGSEVNRLAGVVFGVCAHLTPVFLATLTGQEAHVSMSGRMEFTMRLTKTKPTWNQ
uniref:Uncharacterized protein n=1 Tax=Mastacembelus armatus TaxID=205130 RepID=A0A7N9AKC8_9TELE